MLSPCAKGRGGSCGEASHGRPRALSFSPHTHHQSDETARFASSVKRRAQSSLSACLYYRGDRDGESPTVVWESFVGDRALRNIRVHPLPECECPRRNARLAPQLHHGRCDGAAQVRVCAVTRARSLVRARVQVVLFVLLLLLALLLALRPLCWLCSSSRPGISELGGKFTPRSPRSLGV